MSSDKVLGAKLSRFSESAGGTMKLKIVGVAGPVLGLACSLAACGSTGEANGSACRETMTPALVALQGVQSRLRVGMNESTYSDKVGDAQAALDRATSAVEPGTSCSQKVARALERAAEQYTSAASYWNDAITSDYTVDDLKLNRYWDHASDFIAQAQQSLG